MRSRFRYIFAWFDFYPAGEGADVTAALIGFFLVIAGADACGACSQAGGRHPQDLVVKVSHKGQQELIGKLWELTPEHVVVEEASGQVVSLKLSEVSHLTPVIGEDLSELPPAAASTAKEGRWVQLRSGSILVCGNLVGSEGSPYLECQLMQSLGTGLRLPWSAVQTIRFRALTEELFAPWKELLKRPADRDWIAVLFDSKVDFYSGTVRGLRETELEFELEGERFLIATSRLLGARLAGSSPTSELPLGCRIEHRGGSQILAHQVRANREELWAEVESGLSFRFPWHEISKVDFRGGRVVPLDQLPLVRARYSPVLQLPGLEEALTQLLLPPLGKARQENSLPEASPILLFPVGSEVVWQLPEGDWELSAQLRALSKGPPDTVIRVEWASEETPIKEISLEVGRSENLELELGGTRTLRLRVEVNSGSPIGVFLEVKDGVVIRRF
jgi:hypothetical protein